MLFVLILMKNFVLFWLQDTKNNAKLQGYDFDVF